MPSNLLNADVGFPQLKKDQSNDEKIDKIVNYLYMLLEQLRYSFGNMDKDNFSASGLDELQRLITDPIYMRIEDEERSISTLTLTAQGLQAQVTSAAGAASAAQQTANSITFDVTNGADRSYFHMYRNGVLVASDTIRFTGNVVFASDLTDGETIISGDNIQTGYISASRIGTGTLDADELTLTGLLTLKNGRTTHGYMGCGYGSNGSGQSTYGAFVGGPAINNTIYNYLIATSGGVRMQAGNRTDENNIFVVPGGCYASSEIRIASDRRVKKDIRYDMDRYEKFFMELRPCAYKREREEDGRYHTGFVAQEVESALQKGGLTYEDFDALRKDQSMTPEYSLGYGEFAALNTHMIQVLARRIDALEKIAGTEGYHE